MGTESEFERVDAIRSVTDMRKALSDIEHDARKKVILLGLSKSRHQFTWSFMARVFKVPQAEWPAQPEFTTRMG